jgi:hypothetical protein
MLKTCITWHSVNLLHQLNILFTGKHLRFAVKWKPARLSQENNLPRLSQMSCAKSSLFSGYLRHRTAATGAVTDKMTFYSYSAVIASDGAATVDSSCKEPTWTQSLSHPQSIGRNTEGSHVGPAYYTDLNLDVRPFVAGRCAQTYFVENVVYSHSFLPLSFVYILFGGGLFSLLLTRRDRFYFLIVKFNSLTSACNFCDDCRDCEDNEVLVCAELFLH